MTKTPKDDVRAGFSARLNALCDAMAMPPKGKNRQQSLATMFEVSPNGARKWLEAEGMPTMVTAIQIACWGGVNVEWLLTGRGARVPAEEAIPLSDANLEARPPGDVWRIAGKLARLNDERRRAIEGVIDAFSN